ncbi:uncharacterized protein FPRO_07014 [Fusarium proliferatum ET1]|uniref:Uncharacterized protein n=1 Tax=Fusarium proliferatum (strain ET1) TaxID=1227346 RepID=A0A1L7VEA9_FUSPR|nr:uncharacterized protein FPRO_07014 [Fusarium proliferatum ET1]CZR37795.1 uncharacterized protein FPRO_07014 [Fusarium proliferatum ET1]
MSLQFRFTAGLLITTLVHNSLESTPQQSRWSKTLPTSTHAEKL